jgi:hypothetical protein
VQSEAHFVARLIKEQTYDSTRRTAQTGSMARKSIVSSDGPSTADVSANEDVEMQDQETTQLSGLKKLGVSAPDSSFPIRNVVMGDVLI